MKAVVQTASAPRAIGSYSQGIRARAPEFLFLSGQIPLDPVTGQIINGGIEKQTEQVLKNLEAVLIAGGSCLEKVIKTTIYLRNMDEFSKVNEVYTKFFSQNPPARSTVEVSRLPKDAAIEIDLIAVIG